MHVKNEMFHNFMMNFVITYLYLLAFNFDNVFKYSLYIVDTKKTIPILLLCVILMKNLFNRLHQKGNAPSSTCGASV